MSKVVHIVLSSAVLLASTSTVVNAASIGAYLGAAGGYSTLQPAIDAEMLDDGGFGGRIFAGFNFNRHVGIESNYSTFFKTKYVLNDYQDVLINYKLNALSLVAKGYLPFSDNSPLNIYGLLGAAQMYADIDVNANSNTILSDSDTGLVPTLGFGATYDINQHLTTDLEAAVFGKKNGNENHFGIRSAALVTLGVSYKI